MTQSRDKHDQKAGKVFLVGAGPGDPGLLTLKAVEALKVSDVVIYDYLVNPEILAHARRGVELIFAGKRAGEAYISQDEINQLLVSRAQAGQVVARLKGGDPFLFGRGGEEAQALAEHGIAWDVIPGVSAGLAAGAYAGIPVTHRDYSSSVTFITGRQSRKNQTASTREGGSRFLADTLVVFMCAESIPAVARQAIEAGRLSSTPVAIIRWATYEDQQVFTGTIGELVDLAGEPGWHVPPPAIAIIGEVVALRRQLQWFGAVSKECGLRDLVADLAGDPDGNGTLGPDFVFEEKVVARK